MKNKIIGTMLALILLLGAFSCTALAGHSKVVAKVGVCTVRACKFTKTHKHGIKTYLAHRKNDGHSYRNATHH